ncbi:MAG TPA: OsmC family protein [Terriglobales bacterium]|nr:OsmC family protein [Terriglobales bacterium]
MESTHLYRSSAIWTMRRRGIVSAEDVPRTINFSSPPEFQGEPGLWTPEHLLVAAVATCFLATFRAFAENSRLQVVRLEVEAEGTLEKEEGGFRFTRAVVRPRLTIADQADQERAGRLLEKAERACLISRSLSCRVEMQAQVEVGAPVPA